MLVRNVKEPGDGRCACPSPLAHWNALARESVPAFCPARACMGSDLGAAWVLKENSADPRLHIVPLCRMHRSILDKPFEVSDIYPPVPADVCVKPGELAPLVPGK